MMESTNEATARRNLAIVCAALRSAETMEVSATWAGGEDATFRFGGDPRTLRAVREAFAKALEETAAMSRNNSLNKNRK